jgi:hypothetical protein
MRTITPSILILLLTLGLGSTAWARLGETLEQLQARLGPPAQNQGIARVLVNGKWYPFGQILDFSKGGWSIECEMVNGVCRKIRYIKNAPFTDDDITSILNNEAQGSKWTQSVSTTTLIDGLFMPQMKVREWKRADGAFARIIDKSFTLTALEYARAADAATAQGNAETQKKMPNL